MTWDRNSGCPIHAFSLVVCRHPETGKWLAVEECKDRGWWLPGGFVECGDDHESTAHKETMEEAGLEVILKGILRIENHMGRHGGRQRVIYYAEPKDLEAQPKSHPDKESLRACWMSVVELETKARIPPPTGLRGEELYNWACYIEAGGTIYPLSIFSTEEEPVPSPGDLFTN